MATSASTIRQTHILVVDDEPDLRTLYELTLLREGYQVTAAESLVQARLALKEKAFDVLITDMRLPDGMGLELIEQVVAQRRNERCIVITAYGSAENAVNALKTGAFDYLSKPVDLKHFRTVVASAAYVHLGATKSVLAQENPSSCKGGGVDFDDPVLQNLVGESPVMQAVKACIKKVAPSMAPVLIQGESGTGKELVARAVHACSHRADGPFVAVNCGAIPENLLEAEFFGARKGAYTGASQDRLGYFQAAKGGTLFLDEIGDLPLLMQSKLLRAIQERTVRALGALQEEMVDVRIVSATHKQLKGEVQNGHFRQDLYYRLNVIELYVPALRERREDLPALCQALIQKIGHDPNADIDKLTQALLQRLQTHPFHGNVRELENLLHRAIALGLDAEQADGQAWPVPSETTSDHVTSQDMTIPADLQQFLDTQERNILLKVLQANNFNRTVAASKLGLTLRQIRYRIARLHIAMPHDARYTDDTNSF